MTNTFNNSKKKWTFVPNKDSWGNDLIYFPNKTIHELLEISELYPECVAFNTYGYFKKSIDERDKFINLSNRHNDTDGIFIKNEN